MGEPSCRSTATGAPRTAFPRGIVVEQDDSLRRYGDPTACAAVGVARAVAPLETRNIGGATCRTLRRANRRGRVQWHCFRRCAVPRIGARCRPASTTGNLVQLAWEADMSSARWEELCTDVRGGARSPVTPSGRRRIAPPFTPEEEIAPCRTSRASSSPT